MTRASAACSTVVCDDIAIPPGLRRDLPRSAEALAESEATQVRAPRCAGMRPQGRRDQGRSRRAPEPRTDLRQPDGEARQLSDGCPNCERQQYRINALLVDLQNAEADLVVKRRQITTMRNEM